MHKNSKHPNLTATKLLKIMLFWTGVSTPPAHLPHSVRVFQSIRWQSSGTLEGCQFTVFCFFSSVWCVGGREVEWYSGYLNIISGEVFSSLGSQFVSLTLFPLHKPPTTYGLSL
jgi:hypothetical protein